MSRRTHSDAVRRNIAGDYRVSPDDRTATDRHSVQNGSARSEPGTILDDNAAPAYALLNYGPADVIKIVIYRQYLYLRRDKYRIANGYTTLAAHDHRFANECVATDVDKCMRQVAEIEDVQFSVVHDRAAVANRDPAGRCVQIDTAIQIHPMTESNVARMSQAHIAFDRTHAVRTQDEAVSDSAQTDSEQPGNVSQQRGPQALPGILDGSVCLRLDVVIKPIAQRSASKFDSHTVSSVRPERRRRRWWRSPPSATRAAPRPES